MNRSGKARVVGDGKRGARRGPQAPGHVARRKGQCNRRKQRYAKADDPSWVIAKPVVPAVSHVLKGNKRQHYAGQDKEHHNRRAAREEARTPRAKRLDHDVDVMQEHYQRPEPSQAVKRQDALLVTRHHHPFICAFEQSVPLYTLMDLAYILTRKTPKSGGFGGLAHVHVNGGVQIVYGNMASSYATPMRELLGME